MADLERYQPTGVLFADIPRMDFANVREQARAAQGLSQALDRISDFAFKRAAKQAEIEGQQWAYQNPVTPEQIRAAQESGQPLNLPDANTYFGGAARGVQAAVLRGDLELQARREFALISEAVKAGGFTDLAEVKQRLDAPINGFSKFLAQIDPEEAARFRASISTVGNSVFVDASKQIGDQFKTGQKRQIERAVEQALPLLADTVRTQRDPVMLNKAIELELDKYGVAADSISEQFGNEVRKRMNATVFEAKLAVFSDYILSDKFAPTDTEALSKINRGDLGEYSAVWSGLLDEERIKIRTEVERRQANRYAAEQRDRQELDQRNQRDFTKMYSEWVNPATPPRRRDELRSMMVPLAGGTGDLDKLFPKKEQGEGDALLFSKLREQVESGQITSPFQLHPYVRAGAITASQLNSLQSEIYSGAGRQKSDARKTLNKYAGVGDVISGTFDPKDAAFQKSQKLNARFDSAVDAARVAQEALPPEKRTGIDYNGIAAGVIQQYENEDKADAVKAKARKSLEGFEQIATRKGKTVRLDDRTSVADLERLGVFSGSELTAIKKNLDIIKRP